MSQEIVFVELVEVFVPERTWQKIMRKDRGQINQMIDDFESDRTMVRVVLRPRFDGGYNVEDGRIASSPPSWPAWVSLRQSSSATEAQTGSEEMTAVISSGPCRSAT